MGVVGAAGILDFERSYSGWVKDERRPSNPRSIYQPAWSRLITSFSWRDGRLIRDQGRSLRNEALLSESFLERVVKELVYS